MRIIRINNELLLYILVFMYFIFKPFYIFESGMPQLADFCVIIIFIRLMTMHKDYTIESDKINIINKKIKLYYPFLFWISFISLIWSINLESISIMKPILFYIFNFIALYIIKELYFLYGEKIIYKITKYISLSCIIQLVLSIFIGSNSERATIFFNNPNQLGYYALLSLTFGLYLKKYNNNILHYLLVMSSIYLILISQSKAAILGAFILIMIYTIFKLKRTKFKIISAIILIFICLSGYANTMYEYIDTIPIFHNSIYKIKYMNSENDSSLADGRGYGRLKEIGFGIIYGVGDGEYNRFVSLHGNEVHSGIAGIICCYGIIGFSLLIFFIIKLISLNPKNYILLSGVFLYGITHQIWRNTLLWILLMIICIMNICIDKNKQY